LGTVRARLCMPLLSLGVPAARFGLIDEWRWW
jgi:hypothetical protein